MKEDRQQEDSGKEEGQWREEGGTGKRAERGCSMMEGRNREVEEVEESYTGREEGERRKKEKGH